MMKTWWYGKRNDDQGLGRTFRRVSYSLHQTAMGVGASRLVTKCYAGELTGCWRLLAAQWACRPLQNWFYRDHQPPGASPIPSHPNTSHKSNYIKNLRYTSDLANTTSLHHFLLELSWQLGVEFLSWCIVEGGEGAIVWYMFPIKIKMEDVRSLIWILLIASFDDRSGTSQKWRLQLIHAIWNFLLQDWLIFRTKIATKIQGIPEFEEYWVRLLFSDLSAQPRLSHRGVKLKYCYHFSLIFTATTIQKNFRNR